MFQEQAIAILSGGLDSSVSLYKATKKYKLILALTFDYGQRAALREIQAAEFICKKQNIPHQVLKFSWLAELTNTSLVNRNQKLPELTFSTLDDLNETRISAQAVWVPNRNGLFINVAACYADRLGAQVILTGFNSEEAATFPDNTEEFAQAITQSLSYSTQVHARVESFTQTMNKEEIVREALKLEVPLENLWSCYEGEEKMCGLCESCLRTKRAYQKVGIWKETKMFFKE
jgi:7-cyano-7-deazaguanine synthase